jgi:hypothetical protein
VKNEEGFEVAYVSYGKLSKKKRREIDQGKRVTWGNVSPVTKKVTSEKVYDRKKAQRWHGDRRRWVFCYKGLSVYPHSGLLPQLIRA